MLKNTSASSAIAGDVVGYDSEAMQRDRVIQTGLGFALVCMGPILV